MFHFSDSFLLKFQPRKTEHDIHSLIYLPDGVQKVAFREHYDKALDLYLSQHEDTWTEHFDSLCVRSSTMFVKAVWLAKRFACATYTQPEGTKEYPSAQVTELQPGGKLFVTPVDGFSTIVGPMNSAFEGGHIGCQCVGIQGYVIREIPAEQPFLRAVRETCRSILDLTRKIF